MLAEGIAVMVKQHKAEHKILVFNNANDVLAYKFLDKVDVVITEMCLSDEENIAFFQKLCLNIPSSQLLITSLSTLKAPTEDIIPINPCYLLLNQNNTEVSSKLTSYLTEIESSIFNNSTQNPEDNKKTKDDNLFPILTAIEKKIINLMIKGQTSKQIGELHQNSEHTINNQKNKLIKKFNCNNSTELVVKLIRLGYLQL